MFPIDPSLQAFIWLTVAFTVGAISGFMLCACLVISSESETCLDRKDEDR